MPPATEGRIGGLTGAVLLGGASTRMGRDKAALEVGGVASATRIARLLDTLCDEVLLVGGDAPLAAPGSRIRDPDGPRCALRGLVAALSAAHGARVLVVATDLPLVTPTLLRGLTEGGVADAVVPRPEALAQPLCAVYARDAALARARAQLAAGRLALRGVLEGLVVDWIEGDRLRSLDPDGTALLNVNTPEDHARAETILQARSDVRVVPGAL